MSIFSLAIHGGAGKLQRQRFTQEKEAQHKGALLEALKKGEDILSLGGDALDAVEACVRQLESNPLFNAGRGAVFNQEGKQEMEASVMCGKNRNAGAVAGILGPRHPISLARKVMENSPHVLLIGEGALAFARERGVEFEDEDYFFTQKRYAQWERTKERARIQLDHSEESKSGTVGAVARDMQGNLAAATSTGGMPNKWKGRVGDTALIGAGTYADNRSCAVSCTGHGEFFIRAGVAQEVSALMRHGQLTLAQACHKVIMEEQIQLGGQGGLIAIDKAGNIEAAFSTAGMYRAFSYQGRREAAIFTS